MQRVARIGLAIIELATLSVLILATRCANYQDVFVAGNVYFTDADCYARMTRARMCEKTPGLIIRHHDFENFPEGTTPHTTAPLDYLIVALSISLAPFTAHAIDLAGALISPLLALIGGWFLWWWSRRMKFRYGWVMLILYAISSILVHGTELGRPDHQSLLMLFVTIALCAEWILQRDGARASEVNSRKLSEWSIVGGIAWGLAIWISAYESLVLFFITTVVSVLEDRKAIFAKYRRLGWFCFILIVATALLAEQRIPTMSIFRSNEIFQNWARTIGELAHVSPANPIWFRWAGYLLFVAPFLIWFGLRERKSKSETPPLFIVVLLIATYFLTIWQARWAYFFVLIFAIALPALLEPIKSRAAVSIAFILSIFPVLRDWDARLWPNEASSLAESNGETNRCKCVSWRSSCDRPRRSRFFRPGGFRRRLPIGRGNLAWLEARMRACRELSRVRVFFSVRIGKRHAKFLRIAGWCGSSPTISSDWREIPPPFWVWTCLSIRSVSYSTEHPPKRRRS